MTVISACILVLVAWQVIGPRTDYTPVTELSSRFIEKEIEQKGLPALSIVLVDDQEIVWARGFGMADPAGRIPATAETVYRVGSVSKLFTDIAVMQLVERGELDLDATVSRYLAAFQPGNPYDWQITLRQLMSHRAGLVRILNLVFDEISPSRQSLLAPFKHIRYNKGPWNSKIS